MILGLKTAFLVKALFQPIPKTFKKISKLKLWNFTIEILPATVEHKIGEWKI